MSNTISEFESNGVITTITSAYRNGCEGFVRSAVLQLEDREPLLVKTKSFFRSSYDARGDPFTQSPNEEAEKAWGTYKLLEKKGFRVLPDYGITTDTEGGKSIVMTDLSEGGTKEVYDEGSIHQAKEVEQIIHGQKICPNALEVRRNLDNSDEISLGFLRSGLLSRAHDIILGNGTAHMLVRDPETNLGELYVVDLGEAYTRRSKYRDALSLSQLEKLFEIPEEEICPVFRSLLEAHHPQLVEQAEEIYAGYTKDRLTKKEFQQLFFQAAVGMGLMEWLGGWAGKGKWARKKYVKNEFSEHWLSVKHELESIAENYQKHTKQPLFEVNSQQIKEFIEAKDLADLYIGIDFAFLAAIDKRVQEIIAIRQAIDEDHETEHNDGVIIFGHDNFPRFVFFENFDETRPQKVTMELQCQDLHSTLNGVLLVDFDWEDGYKIATAGGIYAPYSGSDTPIFELEDIKDLLIDQKIVEDFDPSNVEVHIQRRIRSREDTPEEAPLTKGDVVYYMYDDQIIYYLIFR